MNHPHPRPSPRRHAAGLVLVLGLVAAVGCGADASSGNSLGGSIAAINFDLSYKTVDILSDGKALSIRYNQEGGAFPCKLVITSGDGVDLAGGSNIKIDYSALKNNVTLSRQMSANVTEGKTFPNIARGSVIFDQVSLTGGSRVRGGFTIYFYGDDDKIPNGYNLRGQFDGQIKS